MIKLITSVLFIGLNIAFLAALLSFGWKFALGCLVGFGIIQTSYRLNRGNWYNPLEN